MPSNVIGSACTDIAALYETAYPQSYVLLATRNSKQQNEGIYVKKAIRVDSLGKYFSKFRPRKNIDYYITANTFQGGWKRYSIDETLLHHRKDKNLLSINHIVLDIDIHDDVGDANRDRIIQSLIRDLRAGMRAGKLPSGHGIVMTGRGVHVWYTIAPLAKKCRFLSDRGLKRLVELYDDFFANCEKGKYGLYTCCHIDSGASKISGLYRLPFSYNTKANRKVKLYLNENYVIPDIDEFLGQCGLLPKPSRKRREKQANKNAVSSPSQLQPRYFPLLTHRRDMLEWLLGKNKISIGRRNCLMLLYYNTVLQLSGTELGARATRRFNNALASPLTDKELDGIMKHVDNTEDGFYRFKKDNFDLFGEITEEERSDFEMKYMSPSMQMRAQKSAESKARRSARDDQIRELALTGMSQRDIAKELHIGINTVAHVVRPNKAILDSRIVRKEQQIKQIAAMLEAGKSRKDIAKAVGISSATLARRIADMRK